MKTSTIKLTLFLLFLAIVNTKTNAQSIDFVVNKKWVDVVTQAKLEKKIIFIDFYTQWCGPCYLMQKEVFILPEVGNFFNSKFVNLKIDAENGEGIALAKQFIVKVYPTYCFVDPVTENVIHRSTSRQDKEAFLTTARNALIPEKTSVFLLQQYEAGNKTPKFLMDYAEYQAISNRADAINALEKLTVIPGYSLENKEVWKLFCNIITDRKHLLFNEFLLNANKYARLYGQEEVENKLYKSFQFCNNLSEFDKVVEFKGKEFLYKKNKASILIQEMKFNDATIVLENLMANPGNFNKEVCEYLFDVSRFVLSGKSSLNENYPEFWKMKCISFLQYAAYNIPDRENGQIMFTYASVLENLLKSIPESSKILPSDFANPSFGVKEFSNRPLELKRKPVKN